LLKIDGQIFPLHGTAYRERTPVQRYGIADFRPLIFARRLISAEHGNRYAEISFFWHKKPFDPLGNAKVLADVNSRKARIVAVRTLRLGNFRIT